MNQSEEDNTRKLHEEVQASRRRAENAERAAQEYKRRLENAEKEAENAKRELQEYQRREAAKVRAE